MRLIFSLLVSIFLTISSFSQEKFEKEIRVSSEVVPSAAKQWIQDAFDNQCKVKWYEEFSTNSYSWEAKLRWKNHYYSIEFDSSGNLEDVEVTIEVTEIPKQSLENIRASLSEKYNFHKIIKIQIQYTGPSDSLINCIKTNDFRAATIHYEIVFRGKTSGEDEIYEALFDQVGNPLEVKKIILTPSTNLEY